MSILNVDTIQPVSTGTTVTVSNGDFIVGTGVTIGRSGIITATTVSATTVNVGGVLTYQDVTNVDSVGIVTAREGIRVGAGKSIGSDSGTVTYYGDGSNLTNLPAGGKGNNLFVNGSMAIDQRRSGAAEDFASSLVWIVDRFFAQEEGTQNRITVQQVAVTADTDPWNAGFRKAGKITNGNQNDGPVAAAGVHFHYKFEAQDIAQSGWDYTSASSYVQLSFWIKSSVAFTLPFYIRSRDGSARMYSSTQALSANTWTKITRSIPGDPGGLQIDNNNDRGLELLVAPYYGTDGTASGSTLNAWKAWTSSSRFPDVATTWWDGDDATLEFTGFKLEVGDTVTDFDFKPYGEELSRCQRYYQEIQGSNGMTFSYLRPLGHSGPVVEVIPDFLVPMRANPTVTFTGTIQCRACAQNTTSTTITLSGSSFETPTSNVTTGHFWCNAASGNPFTAGYSGRIISGAAGSSVNFSAEL